MVKIMLEVRQDGAAGTPNGRAGSYSLKAIIPYTYYGAAGFSLGFNSASGSYGQGGSFTLNKFIYKDGSVGGSGGYNSGYVNVTPGTTYTINVGSGGAKKKLTYMSSWDTWGDATDGSSGFVLIAFGGEI